ncbi:MAG: hypothetical protein GWO24_38030, partial [Akkermansiaceae bacterium]|nr:hypothetical protein [Akkermansiaceae bacterium]
MKQGDLIREAPAVGGLELEESEEGFVTGGLVVERIRDPGEKGLTTWIGLEDLHHQR